MDEASYWITEPVSVLWCKSSALHKRFLVSTASVLFLQPSKASLGLRALEAGHRNFKPKCNMHLEFAFAVARPFLTVSFNVPKLYDGHTFTTVTCRMSVVSFIGFGELILVGGR